MGYEPSIPRSHTNWGEAFWRFDADEFGARLYAPVFAGWRALLVGTVGLILVLAVCGGVSWAFARHGWTQEAKQAVAMCSIVGVLALGGIWGVVLVGNVQESQRGDLVTYDAATQQIELPRRSVGFPKRDLIRLEFVLFDVRGTGPNSEWWRLKDLVLVRRDGTREVFELLVRGGFPMKRRAEEMAAHFGIPLQERHLGTFRPLGEM